MNKFKLISNSLDQHRKNDFSSENKHPKRDEIQLLNLLDKCTQILRDDRIWIRNKVKQGDNEILNIFKKHKKPLNMQQLQINLRKHVTKIKQQYKLEQLNKFKENMCTNFLLNEKNKNVQVPSRPKKQQNNNGHEIYENLSQTNFMNEYLEKQRKQMENNRKTKMNNQGFPEPIQQQQEAQKLSSYRSDKDERKKNRFGFINQINQQNNNNWMKQVLLNHHDQHFNKNHEQSIKNQDQSFKMSTLNGDFPSYMKKEFIKMDQAQNNRPQIPSQSSIYYDKKQQKKINNQKKSDYSGSPFYEPSHQVQNIIQNSVNQTHQTHQLSHQDPGISINNNLIYNNTFNLQNMMKNLKFQNDIQKQRPILFKQEKKNQNLFTSPELLLQCRKILRQNQSSKKQSRIFETGYTQNQPSLFGINYQKPQNQLFKINYDLPVIDNLKNSPFKPTEKNKSIFSLDNMFSKDTYSDTKPSFLQVPAQQQIMHHSDFLSIRNLYAEDVFQIILQNQHSHHIQKKVYQQTIRSLFNNYQDYHLLLQTQPYKNTVSVLQIGQILDRVCRNKSNRVRQIFSLIDFEKKGYFGQDQYQRFLDQIMQSQQQGSEQISIIAAKLFKLADLECEKQVGYWGLYWRKNTPQFIEFSQYLQQFQFQIQS